MAPQLADQLRDDPRVADREVSNAELLERIEHLQRAFDELRDDVLTRDVADERRRADQAELKLLEFRVTSVETRQERTRQLAWSGLVLPVLVMLIGGVMLAFILGAAGP